MEMRIFNGKLKPCASKYLMKYREKQGVFFRRTQTFRFRYFSFVWMSYMHISVHKHTFIYLQSISQVLKELNTKKMFVVCFKLNILL